MGKIPIYLKKGGRKSGLPSTRQASTTLINALPFLFFPSFLSDTLSHRTAKHFVRPEMGGWVSTFPEKEGIFTSALSPTCIFHSPPLLTKNHSYPNVRNTGRSCRYSFEENVVNIKVKFFHSYT
jgi:hypothetical protein